MSASGATKRLPVFPALSWDDCRLLVQGVTDYAIFMLDVDGHVATWNLGAEKIKGYRADEIVGRHFSCFYPEEDRRAGKPERALALALERGRYEDESWRVRKDGTRFWADVVITALRDPDGSLRGFGKVTRDLTQRRAAEEQLRQSEERFHHLVDAITDYAVFMLDASGRVATWNPGAENAKGYTPEEIIGRHFSVFYTAEDRVAGRPQAILDAVAREGRFEDESWRLRKDGTRFWANVVITALRNDEGEVVGFAKVTKDLTARRAAESSVREALVERTAREAAQANEQAMRRAAERAEESARRAAEANRLKDEFLATVSHELRTPLNAILGYADLLRAGDATPETLAKGLEVIHRNAESQARIIEDILDVSRIITGQLRLDVDTIDPSEIVTEAVEVVRPSARSKGIEIEVKTSPGTTLAADPLRLRQVVWNLLSNAVKFTDAGGHIVVASEAKAGSWILAVHDTGQGIEPAFLPHVFDRFRQAEGSTTRRVGGLGLGLAIVRHLVELHGGRVGVESAGLGKGSTFRVTLPLQASSSGPADEAAPTLPDGTDTSEETVSLSGLRVIVVEDDADSRALLEQVLSSAGATVRTAGNASEGFEAVRTFHPDVLVSDIGMPHEDGFSFMRRVRELDRAEGGGVPAIALTAYTRNQDRARALAAGFTTHVGKPVDHRHLVAAIANLAALIPR